MHLRTSVLDSKLILLSLGCFILIWSASRICNFCLSYCCSIILDFSIKFSEINFLDRNVYIYIYTWTAIYSTWTASRNVSMFGWKPRSVFYSRYFNEDVQVFFLFFLWLGQGGEDSAPYWLKHFRPFSLFSARSDAVMGAGNETYNPSSHILF